RGPCSAGGSEEDEKQQGYVGRVQQDAGQVKPARPVTEKRAVKHQGEPRQRVVVAVVDGGEGPADVVPRQAMEDARVFVDVLRIIVIDETAPRRRPEGDQGKGTEQNGEKDATQSLGTSGRRER